MEIPQRGMEDQVDPIPIAAERSSGDNPPPSPSAPDSLGARNRTVSPETPREAKTNNEPSFGRKCPGMRKPENATYDHDNLPYNELHQLRRRRGYAKKDSKSSKKGGC